MVIHSNIIKQSKKLTNVNSFNWPLGWDCYHKIRFFMHEHNMTTTRFSYLNIKSSGNCL